jgi:hypothetical protein
MIHYVIAKATWNNFLISRMKILQLVFIQTLYGSITRDYWWSSMEIEGNESANQTSTLGSRDVPTPANTMQREGDSPKQSDPESTSIFPRFILNCMGCCVPSCFTKPKSTDEDEDPRSPISGPITKEPVGKPKAHDSGEDEEFSSDSSTERLAGYRSVRGMQLRRRQGVSPPRPSSEPKVVSYVSGLLQKSRRENSGDPKEIISEVHLLRPQNKLRPKNPPPHQPCHLRHRHLILMTLLSLVATRLRKMISSLSMETPSIPHSVFLRWLLSIRSCNMHVLSNLYV